MVVSRRASNTVQTGSGWSNVNKSYDADESTYAVHTASGGSACHINGFGFNIPSNAVVEKVVVRSKIYLKNSYGYYACYLYTDTGSSISHKIHVNKAAVTTPAWYTLEVPAATIQSKLDSLGVYGNNIVRFINEGLRVRWVGPRDTSSYTCEGRVYDIIVDVYYQADSTITFDSCGGSSVASQVISAGGTYGTLPTPTRTGYTFMGWFKTKPVFNSGYFNGSRFEVVPRSYMYTDKIAVHIEAYMSDWSNVVDRQLISCTESGGWGIGYGANTVGHGTEIYIGGYKGVDFGIASLSAGWHSFDFVYTGSSFIGYVDSASKGSVSASGAITYHSSNAIFIGAEAGSSATTPASLYFLGNISSVIIENSGSRIVKIASTDSPTGNLTLYAGWKINNYTVSVAKQGTGTVTGGGTVAYGETVNISATAGTGYKFVRWTDGNTSASRTVTVTANTTYTAVFESLTKTVTVSASPAEGGSVSGGGTYNTGASATLTATAKAGYKFVRWTDGNTTNPRTITVNADCSYTAVFEKITYSISVGCSSGGVVSVLVNGTVERQSVSSATITVNHGDTVTFLPAESSGYSFGGWSDGVTTAIREFTATGNVNVTANFVKNKIDVNFSCGEGGSLIEAYVNGLTVFEGKSGSIKVDDGTELTVVAYNEDGYAFFKWSDGNADNPRVITVTGNLNLSAVFSRTKYTVTANASAGGSITVLVNGTVERQSVSSATINVNHGDTVTIIPVENVGYSFVGWSDGVQDEIREFTATEDFSATANFKLKPPEFLSVSVLYGSHQVSDTNKVPCGEGYFVTAVLKN